MSLQFFGSSSVKVSGVNLVNVSPYYTFSMSNVDTDDNGKNDTLRLTLTSVNINTFEDVKSDVNLVPVI